MSFRLAARARRISTARLTVFERASGASVLFEDRYAALLSGEGGEVAPADLATVTSLADTLAIRTRAIDAWLEKPSWPPVRTTRRQVVLLGTGGLDTRSYRLGLGQSCKIFEVEPDMAILANKRKVMADAGVRPRTAVVDVNADPSDAKLCSKALLDAGLDPNVPTRWVVEGPFTNGATLDLGTVLPMASSIGGTPASALAAQVLEPAWSEQFLPSSMQPPQGLASSVSAVLDTARAAGWREKRTLRHDDLLSTFGRAPHPAFALIFADADTDPSL